ncbi:ion transport protein [Ditylenchus destructor]|nr:ion transport protein [Ditylenchus destructor]
MAVRVTTNMISGAAQHHKRRQPSLRKTDAMQHAERANGRILDEIWRNGGNAFQAAPPSRNIPGPVGGGILCNYTQNNSTQLPNCKHPIGSANHRSDSLQKTPAIFVQMDETKPSSSEENDQLIPVNSEEEHFLPEPESSANLLRLNIGGTTYMLLVDAILRADQSSFLAKFVQFNHIARLKVADGYLPREDAYFFQRSPLAFDPIFQYYATGVVHRPPEMCPIALAAELEFWRISPQSIGSCCAEDIAPLPKLILDEDENVDDTTFEKLMCGQLRRRMWTFLERPGSSFQAKAFELSSTLFVAISVMGLSFGTIPDFQVIELIPTGQTESITFPNGTKYTQEHYIQQRVEHPAFVFTERVCIAFFTVEYCLRMFASPNKLKYALKPLNLVDLLAILPFYLELVLTLCGVDDRKLKDLRWAFLVVRILRVLRVIRIIKLGRFSSGLQTFGMTLQRSQKQLQMMTIVLLTGVVFFSTMIYFLEKDEEGTPFTSIPAAYWWCIVTMTTVGYGDVVPTTTVGKVVASAAIMSGVLVLALPITIIVDNFIKVAQDEQQAEQYKEAEIELRRTISQEEQRRLIHKTSKANR